MCYNLGCRASVSVELVIPTHPRKILCIPDAGAPWNTDEAALRLTHYINEVVFTEKVTSAPRPQRIATLKHFPSWYCRNKASAVKKVVARGNVQSVFTTGLPRCAVLSHIMTLQRGWAG